MGRASRRKRDFTRAQRTSRRPAPAQKARVERAAHGAVAIWIDAKGMRHERHFATYQQAQSHAYAALRGAV